MIFFWKKKKEEKTDSKPYEKNETDIQKDFDKDSEIADESEIEDELLEEQSFAKDNPLENILITEDQNKEIPQDYEEPKIVEDEIPEEKIEPLEEEEKPIDKKGFFQRLKERLGKTKESVFNKVKQIIRLKGKVDEELLEEIEEILIKSDVGVETTLKIIEKIRNSNSAREAKDSNSLIEEFKKAILDIIKKEQRTINLSPEPPTVILVTGVNGTGKTTTIGKLAKQFSDSGKKVMLVAGDTFRAAAIEQLEIWAKRTKSEFVSQKMGADPASVCFDALNSAKKKKIDIVLIDTAGRLHTKVNLMEELKKVVRVIKKVIPDAPHETLLVLDATTGQNAISQAKIFSEAVSVSGIIMTKLDGTAKGGILIAISDLFKTPILKIGVGEKINDLRDFDPQEFVDALFEE